MISEERTERRSRAWWWTIPLSALLHFLIVPAALWIFAAKLVLQNAKPVPQEQVVASTAVRIEHRVVPQRISSPNKARQSSEAPAPAAPPAPRPQRRAAASVPIPAVPTAPPRELARISPSAPPQASPQPTQHAPSQPSTLQQEIDAQQHAFSREVAQLRSQNAPLSIATKAPQPPSAFHRTYFDVPGHRPRNAAQALLFPLQHWTFGDMSCYYTRYIAQFENGATEDGTVPWPVCYPKDDDRLAESRGLPGIPLPIPYPQPSYHLPAGTYLSQFLKRVYDGRP